MGVRHVSRWNARQYRYFSVHVLVRKPTITACEGTETTSLDIENKHI
jgi:hypothetical protein